MACVWRWPNFRAHEFWACQCGGGGVEVASRSQRTKHRKQCTRGWGRPAALAPCTERVCISISPRPGFLIGRNYFLINRTDAIYRLFLNQF